MTNRHGEITLIWADGTYTFRLALGQWRELQEKTNCGPLELFERLLTKRWRLDDLREIVRLGLLGGSKDVRPEQALNLVQRYVEERPFTESVSLALKILAASVFSPEEDDARPKADAEKGTPDESASPLSTGTLQ